VPDEVDNIKKEIVSLPPEKKMVIARDVIRGLDQDYRDEIIAEFKETPQDVRQFWQRMSIIGGDSRSSLFALLC